MEEEQVNHIARTMGLTLLDSGKKMLKSTYKIKYTKVGKVELEKFISKITGIKTDSISMQDQQYFLTEWSTWKKIINYDWLDKKQYISDQFDCDNFADSFKARMAEIYGLNTAGRFSNYLYNKITGKEIGAHRANIIVALEKNALVAYMYEPMNDGFCKIEVGKKVENPLNNWEYRGHYIALN